MSASGAANLKQLVDVLEPSELASIVLDKVSFYALSNHHFNLLSWTKLLCDMALHV